MNLALSLKSFLSKLNFLLGNKPKILPYSKDIISKFIPPPYRAAFIISCDFELAWGWRFAKEINCSLERAKEIARNERRNVPLILGLCEKFNIPLTWATVGHLFLERCCKEAGNIHSDIPRIAHFENEYWEFSSGNWFDQDPCSNLSNDPQWYAPDLIEKIINSKVKHEIACHSFSHIDCSDSICPENVFRKETQRCKELASAYGRESKSFIFPGNLIGNLKILKEEGFTSYRVDKDILGFPEKDKYGLWQIPTTAAISASPYNWNLDYYIKRYTAIIERAIKYQRLCHFWFHPSQTKEFIEAILARILEFTNLNRGKIYISTMNEYVKFLGKIN